MIWSSLVPKWPILVPFCGMDHQISNFSLISDTLPEEAVEASRCHFFENWLIKHKCAFLLKSLGTIIQENYRSFYLSEPFRIIRFNMRHHVDITLPHVGFLYEVSFLTAILRRGLKNCLFVFISARLLTIFYLDFYIPFLFGLLFPFSLWTFISLFS